MAELEGIMAAASLEGTSIPNPASPPTSPESPGFNDGHKQKARKQPKFRYRRDPKSSTDQPTSTTARTGTPRSKPKSLPEPSQSQPSGSKDSASPPATFWMMHVKPEQFKDDLIIDSMIDTPSDYFFQRVLKSQPPRIAEMLIDRERNRPIELMARAIELETIKRMGFKYSDPVIREDKILAWPMIEYKKRRLDQEAKPMLFFDISRKPTDPAYKPFYLAFEGGEELPADVLEEYLQLPLSPNFPLQMIRIRCEHEVLINWDVIVERKDDQLRVIDVFEAIYNTYNTPLNSQERKRYRDLIDSDIVDAAFMRRSKYIPADFGPMMLRGFCRVDLLGNTTLFNGLFFDETFKQYCLTLREQDPNDIRLSPLF
ncbi:hypothetical protein H0H93_003875 [Arthromyces matolae]|nr:hypothetical protein H0H93_003875 [Arthromyces matolae]